jgi:hypothetical protein
MGAGASGVVWQTAPKVQQTAVAGSQAAVRGMQVSAHLPSTHRPLQHWLELLQKRPSGRQVQRR